MNQHKTPMIMGGSLLQAIRGNRNEARGSISLTPVESFAGVLDRQIASNRTVTGAQTLAAHGHAATPEQQSRPPDLAADPMQSVSAKQSIKSIANAIRQEFALQPSGGHPPVSRASLIRQNSPLLPLGPIPLRANGNVDQSLLKTPEARKQRAGAGFASHARKAKGGDGQNFVSHPSACELGKLSARFESGLDGINAIGYDRRGGTSYGKYQIASRPGSMKSFIAFLREEAPDFAEKLAAAGPANTGGRSGKMPGIWREIAAAEPERFGALQEKFILETHYNPAADAVKKAGFAADEFSPALKEVLWSTAVQHGPTGAARIFVTAAEQVGLQKTAQSDKDFIKEIYARRAGKFESSSDSVRAAAQNRLRQERNMALGMINSEQMA
jgi:hypothetical protein